MTTRNYAQANREFVQMLKNHFRCKGFWRMSKEEQTNVIVDVLTLAAEIYNVEFSYNVDLDNTAEYERTGGMCIERLYGEDQLTSEQILQRIRSEEMTLEEANSLPVTSVSLGIYKASLMTLLHAIRTVMTLLIQDLPMIGGSSNMVDSIVWAHTMFKAALPILYSGSAHTGKFFHRVYKFFPLEGVELRLEEDESVGDLSERNDRVFDNDGRASVTNSQEAFLRMLDTMMEEPRTDRPRMDLRRDSQDDGEFPPASQEDFV